MKNNYITKHFFMFRFPWAFFINHTSSIISPLYQRFVVPHKVNILRKKNIIDVVFVVEELGSWKTEELYLKMLQHPRFEPILLLLPEKTAHYASEIVERYFLQKHYEYFVLQPGEKIWTRLHPDIIFYQKPYGGVIPDQYFFQYNLKSLFCYVPYSFRNRCFPGLNDIVFSFFAWQVYAENEQVINELKSVLRDKGRNMVVTGLSIMDNLLKDQSYYPNTWKQMPYIKKRIIYAPHHTVSSGDYKSTSPYDYATFFEYADFILELADKYRNQVQWAFKPHPLLRMKLEKIWGKKRTDDYYTKWKEMDCCQIEEGEYLGLFKHSDAMIHDCGSFKIEYLYTGNPVMYLIKDNQEFDYPNWQTKEAMNLHYKGYNKNDIENFIIDVISGKDSLKNMRQQFVKDYLTPPNGKKACENIINAILGEEEYA